MTDRRTTLSDRRTLMAVALVAVLVVSAFAFVDFHASTSRTVVDRSVSTGSVGDATANLSGTVVLYVAGDGALSGAVRDELAGDLREMDLAVETPDALRADFDVPALVVVPDRSVHYNPVRPTAEVTWTFLYSASGNLSQFGRQSGAPSTVPFDGAVLVERLGAGDLVGTRMDDEVRFVRKGTLSLHDRTFGISSWPAYRRHLASVVSEHTVDAVIDG